MTSDTFTSADRSCSVGITVSQRESPSTNYPTVLTGTEATNANNFNNTIQNKPASNSSSATGIIGGAIVGIITVLILVIIIFVVKKRSRINDNQPGNGPEVVEYKSPSGQPVTNQDSGSYANADVQNSGTGDIRKPNSTDNYDYADTTVSISNNEISHFPIYSQVNKDNESTNEGEDSDNSGMVDNIVYVSAGPK